jgi:predicted transcriptional regulator
MGKRYNVEDMDFALAYKSSTSLTEVAEKTGMSIEAVKARKKRMEDANVVFPPFPVKPKIDAVAINALFGTTPKTDAPATPAE